jgi:hypothetical protein
MPGKPVNGLQKPGFCVLLYCMNGDKKISSIGTATPVAASPRAIDRPAVTLGVLSLLLPIGCRA